MIALCIQIYFARILDVTLNTIRTFYTLKGKSIISTIISFFEVLVWFLVAREALNINLNSVWIPISYALGYATGNLIGSFISNNCIKTEINVTVITKKNNNLVNLLRDNAFEVSIIDLKNSFDNIKKQMFIIETSKKNYKRLIHIIKSYDINSCIMVSDIKKVEKYTLEKTY